MTNLHNDTFRENLKATLRKAGLLATIQRLRRLITNGINPEFYRRKRAHRRLFRQFKRQYGNVLQHRLNGASHEQKIALVCSVHFPEMHIELAIIKALELAGFTPVVLIGNTRWLLPKYYNLAGITEVYAWRQFVDQLNMTAAEAAIARYSSVQELMTFEYEGARVGRHAVSSALRASKMGSLDVQLTRERHMLVRQVAVGMAYAKAAQRILQKFRPELVVMTDKGYTVKGELFDHCLARGIDVVSWDLGHKSNALILKRFTYENRDQQTNTLSPESWRYVRSMELTDVHREQLQLELYRNYANNDWFSIAGTQHNKRFMDADDIRTRLGLAPGKKTAFIFPHISWDASLFWGGSLFDNYEEWLIETVRAACANDQVSWVIKIHPAHVGKSLREGFRREPAEVISLRKHIGALPPHIFMIPATTDISTFSLFELMDYCLTVRGTVGIEAARLGIPVLTAGAGPYDHKGFTIDSESREQYLDRVRRIQAIPRPSSAQQELAEHFAFGHFMLRPLHLSTITIKYHPSLARHLAQGQINIKTPEEWYTAPDLNALADWFKNRDQLDFLNPLPELPPVGATGMRCCP